MDKLIQSVQVRMFLQLYGNTVIPEGTADWLRTTARKLAKQVYNFHLSFDAKICIRIHKDTWIVLFTTQGYLKYCSLHKDTFSTVHYTRIPG